MQRSLLAMRKLWPLVFFTRHARNSVQRHFALNCISNTLFAICLRCSARRIRSIHLSIYRAQCVYVCVCAKLTIFELYAHFLQPSLSCSCSFIRPFISEKYTIVFEIQSNEFSNCTMKYVNTFSTIERPNERKKKKQKKEREFIERQYIVKSLSTSTK